MVAIQTVSKYCSTARIHSRKLGKKFAAATVLVFCLLIVVDKFVYSPSLGSGQRKHYDASCPRFATMRHYSGSGLGHKFSEIVLGMFLATQTNSSYVFDDRIWQRDGPHGNYAWFPDFFPVQRTYVTMSEFKREFRSWRVWWWRRAERVNADWVTLVEEAQEKGRCNVLFETRIHQCCEEPGNNNKCWCTAAQIGAYERMKHAARQIYQHSTYVPAQNDLFLSLYNKATATTTRALTVAWHLRAGDIVLNAKEDYFQRLSSQLAQALSLADLPVHVFFFGEENSRVAFPFLSDICLTYFQGNCSFPQTDVRDTLFHMIHSEVLITSGSAFPIVAALIRSKGVTLSAFPKEGVVGVYETSESGLISKQGDIVKPSSLKELASELLLTYNQNRR